MYFRLQTGIGAARLVAIELDEDSAVNEAVNLAHRPSRRGRDAELVARSVRWRVGKLLRRMVEGNELLAECDRSDPRSVETAERGYRRWLDRRYVAVRSDDGAHVEPLTGNRQPVEAAEVILTTAMGGG
jgi:glycine cleavage system pyridoxal-binding protein P